MGITGLLPFLKKIHVPINISQFQGATVAIDVYCWLHKGAFSCAEKLAFGESTDQYIHYCLKYVNYMISKNLKPILVFDGCHLPSKKDVEDRRKERRNVYRQKAAQFLKEGKRSEAKECLQRCVDITSEMARKLIEACQQRGIDCIVAPYEADAQLAYLSQSGIAQLVVTEDSDLLLFGCDKVIFKMDFFGNGIMIEKSRLNEVIDFKDGFYTFNKFRQMCILSGCDYLSSLPGIGLINACKVFKLARQADLRQLLHKIPSYLNKSFTVPNDYVEGFIRAENTFLYQLVFDPLTRRLVPLNPYAEDLTPSDIQYAGKYLPNSEAVDIALGNTDIYTREKMSHFNPDTDLSAGPRVADKYKGPHMLSIWSRNYRIISKRFQEPEKSPIKERTNLKNKEIVAEFKVAQQPRKRLRNVENCLESKSDNELSHLYFPECPSVKKTKLLPKIDENVNIVDEDSVSILSSLLDEQDDSPVDKDKTAEVENCQEPDFTSMKQNKTPVLDTYSQKENQSLDCSVDAVKEKNLSQIEEISKENEIKQSTHRNRFAALKQVKRFDINAPKVHSRYFQSPKEERGDNIITKSSSLSQLYTDETFNSEVTEEKTVNNNNNSNNNKDDGNNNNNKDDGNNNNNNNKINSNNKDDENKKKNNSKKVSPSRVNKEIKPPNKTLSILSAFSWGPRHVSYGNNKPSPEPVLFDSDDKEKVSGLSPIPENSDNINYTTPRNESQFNSTVDSSANESELFDSGIACSPLTLNGSSLSEPDTGELISASQESTLGINSLMLCSQESQDSKCATPIFNNDIARVSTAMSKSPKTPNCRVSGLSKKTVKKSPSVASIKQLNGQQSIKDMFSKFAYTRSKSNLV